MKFLKHKNLELYGTTSPDSPCIILGNKTFSLKVNMLRPLRPYPGQNLPGMKQSVYIVIA